MSGLFDDEVDEKEECIEKREVVDETLSGKNNTVFFATISLLYSIFEEHRRGSFYRCCPTTYKHHTNSAQ